MTELAIVLPVLMLIMAGVLDLGRFAYVAATVANAAREGARYGAANPCYQSGTSLCTSQVDPNSIKWRAQNEAYGSAISPAQLTVLTTLTQATCALGNPITVTVSYQFQLITSFIVGGGTIPIRASDQMPVFGTCP